jgi:hypothetical protein
MRNIMSMSCTVNECMCFYYELDPEIDPDLETCNCGHVMDEHEEETDE